MRLNEPVDGYKHMTAKQVKNNKILTSITVITLGQKNKLEKNSAWFLMLRHRTSKVIIFNFHIFYYKVRQFD